MSLFPANGNDDYYKTGETIEFDAGTPCLCAGYCAISSKYIYFTVPLVKKMKSAPASISIPATTEMIYYPLVVSNTGNGNGRVVIANASTVLNIAATLYRENMLTIAISKKDGTVFVDAQDAPQRLPNQSLVNVVPSFTVTF